MNPKDLQKENQELKAKLKEYDAAIDHFAHFWELAGYVRQVPVLSWLMIKTVRGVRKSKWQIAKLQKIKIVNGIKNTSPEIVAICHPSFRGIKSATKAMVEDIIEIPEVYFAKQVGPAINILKEIKPKTVLLSGYPTGYDIVAKEIKKALPSTRLLFLSHASFTWYNLNLDEEKMLEKMLQLHQKGVIEKIGFVKKDNADYFKKKGMDSFYVMNRFKVDGKKQHKLNRSNPNIGVFGSNMWHRNILNQVVAATLVESATIHVNELGEYSFLKDANIKRHGILPKEEFEKLFESMDINLYVSFTDCFPMSIIESMSVGIPCIASYTSDVYTHSPYLREKMIITKIDSPYAIAAKVREVIEDYEEIQAEITRFLPILQQEVEKSIEQFLS